MCTYQMWLQCEILSFLNVYSGNKRQLIGPSTPLFIELIFQAVIGHKVSQRIGAVKQVANPLKENVL